MSRIYRTKFTRPGFKFKETLLVGTLKGAFEDAQQKHRIRNSDP
jgi:hypothetical protein